jgi:hypothetical protein
LRTAGLENAMIDENLEKALCFIRDKAGELAEAKANRVYLEQFRKSKKAILFSQSTAKTIAEKENEAYSHPEYLEVLDGLRTAVEIEEKLKFQMIAAQLKIEVWRSKNANNRFEQRQYGVKG